MNRFLKKCLGAVAVIALLPALPAAAEGCCEAGIGPVVIEQVQLGSAIAALDVHVPDHTDGAAAISTAVGNSAAGLLARGDIDFDAVQTNDGYTQATTQLNGGNITGQTYVGTTAYANAAQGGTTNGNSFYRADQVSTGTVNAGTTIRLRNVDAITTATVAAANVSVSGSEFGDNRAFQTQKTTGTVTASTDAALCCTNASGTFVTTASGNIASSTSWTSTTYNGAVQETGPAAAISATSSVYMADGNDVTGAATASGNSYVLTSEWGYATLGRPGSKLYQGNEAAIDAVSVVELDHWSGTAHASAYGVGNAAAISNIGSDTALNAIQGNYGAVSATADLSGQSWVGGAGVVNATAIGNAASGFLCNTCGEGALIGNTYQTNSGAITANARAYSLKSGPLTASASAVGNASTFTSSGH
jgi:hypothetical protein